jgi:hypothetical protein
MTTPLASDTGDCDLAIREPVQAEVERVLYLFGKTAFPAEAQFLAAVRARPIERFVAAVAWWPAGTTGLVRLACRPGASGGPAAGLLIERIAEYATRAGMQTLQYADLLPADNECVEELRRKGFERLRSERFFEVPVRNLWTRVTQLHEKHQAEIPAGWRTDPIRLHPPEVILDLIAPHRLLPPTEVCQAWQPKAAMGFDLDLSCILFDRERAFGALLLRHRDDVLQVDVQVVQEPNPRLRSLGDICLIYHDTLRVAPDGPIRRIQFRSGETEHRQTANLALRTGGRELPARHVFGRSLTVGQEV